MRAVIRFVLSLVIILAIAWVGLWWYAEGRMDSGFTAWADQLATQGWKVSYNTLTRGTSPLKAQITLTNLALSPPPDAQGRSGTITLPSAGLEIDALNPLVLHTNLPNQIGVDIGDDIGAAVTFTGISLTEQLDTHALFSNGAYPYRSGTLAASGIDILASQGSLLVLHIDAINSHFTIDPDAGSAAAALAGTENFDGIAVSPLMTHLLSIPFGGRIAHLGLTLNVSGPLPPGLAQIVTQFKAIPTSDQAAQQRLLVPVVHSWAAGGGSGNLAFTGVLGPTTISSDAAVKFDANLQPEGNADLTANHLDEFFATLANAYPPLQSDIAQAEAELSTYLTATNTGGQTLAMHATFGNGAITINGQKTAPLPTINWTTLENPPLAPPQAPGDGSGAAQ